MPTKARDLIEEARAPDLADEARDLADEALADEALAAHAELDDEFEASDEGGGQPAATPSRLRLPVELARSARRPAAPGRVGSGPGDRAARAGAGPHGRAAQPGRRAADRDPVNDCCDHAHGDSADAPDS